MTPEPKQALKTIRDECKKPKAVENCAWAHTAMREILFRGKRTDNGEWIEGYFCGKVNETIFSPATESAQIIDKDLYWHEVIPETVGQYTGLTDVNGKKIFEGDIVIIRQDSKRSVYGECKGEVCYSGAGYLISGVSDALSLYAFRWFCEVIGNIHDNPELLSGEVKSDV